MLVLPLVALSPMDQKDTRLAPPFVPRNVAEGPLLVKTGLKLRNCLWLLWADFDLPTPMLSMLNTFATPRRMPLLAVLEIELSAPLPISMASIISRPVELKTLDQLVKLVIGVAPPMPPVNKVVMKFVLASRSTPLGVCGRTFQP